MADEQNKPTSDEAVAESRVSELTVVFQFPGSAEFGVKSKNVSPAQMLAAAAWLDWYARTQFDDIAKIQHAQMADDAKKQRIAIPGVRVPASLKTG